MNNSSGWPPVRAATSSTNNRVCSADCRPGTTLSTRRLSASKATWSQQSPQGSSAGSARLQCASFLATKDHVSSNWTSRVCGGKSHDVVVEVVGVAAGLHGQADDGVLVHPRQAAGLADAHAFVEVGQDGEGFRLGQAAVE